MGKLGDATRETVKTCGSASGTWYSGKSSFPSNNQIMWIKRGDEIYSNYKSIFAFGGSTGDYGAFYSFRAVLSAQDGSSNTLNGN